jgi:predicted RNA binding protein YcfA (HicA-like mRNA interferase family)
VDDLKIPATSGKKLIKALTKLGFVATRQRGSHVRLENRDGGDIVKITVPLHKELRKGTLKRIIKDSNLRLEDIIRYLLIIE